MNSAEALGGLLCIASGAGRAVLVLGLTYPAVQASNSMIFHLESLMLQLSSCSGLWHFPVGLWGLSVPWFLENLTFWLLARAAGAWAPARSLPDPARYSASALMKVCWIGDISENTSNFDRLSFSVQSENSLTVLFMNVLWVCLGLFCYII